MTIKPDGMLSVVAPYTLPVMTGNVLSGVKLGANVTIAANGTLSDVEGAFDDSKAVTPLWLEQLYARFVRKRPVILS